MAFLSPRDHWAAVRELAGLPSRHRELTWEMTKREVRDRYTRHILGAAWAVCHPLILVAVYFFLFVIVHKAEMEGSKALFTIYFLSGFLPWLAVQESMNKNAAAITSNANLVKQVVFPLEVLPIKGALSSMLPQLVGTVALIVYVLAAPDGRLWWTYLLLPVLMILQCIGMIGLGFLLSSIGAYFRDLKDVVQVFSFVGVFLMPVFYLPDQVPALFKPVIYANPFSYMVWCYQDACYFGRFEHPWAWGVFAALSLGTFYAGYLAFRRLKPMFGNVL